MSYAPDTLPPVDDWRKKAACDATTTDLFFPVGEGPLAQQQTADAKRICHTCPVMDACLRWALNEHQDVGVWGGLDERQRRRIHKRRPVGAAPAKPPRTPETVLAAKSATLPGGHVAWTGSSPVIIHGEEYTAPQLAWVVAYGALPVGHLTRSCSQPGCIAPEHRLDAAGRKALHGSRAGYLAHRRRGEKACDECLAANRAEQPRRKTKTPVPECGTRGGYDAHLSRREDACDACCTSRWGQQPAVPDCGTRSGYRAHLARGEAACQLCRDANANADWLLRNTGTTKQPATA
ncbi:WhiB family transcriptional regulator [Streptomyces sp. NPDC048445]|uniref:WhiB family transcriptional regulator n=1 Tax=Streptomyces sp. NPDC048445 TaxID=3365553 RepID=UPI00371B48DB